MAPGAAPPLQATVRAPRGGAPGRLLRGLWAGDGTFFAFAQTLATQVLVLALNLVSGVLTARLLGPEGRGAMGVITLWPPFMAILFTAGVPAALIHALRNADKAGRGAVLGATLVLSAGLSLLAAAACAVGLGRSLGERAGEYDPLLVLAPLVAVLCLQTILVRSALTALGRFGSFNLASWADPAIYSSGLVALALVSGLTVTGAVLCLWLGTLLCFLWLAWRLATIEAPRLRGLRGPLAALGSFSVRGAGAEILGALVGHLDRLVLLALLPLEAFGLYLVAYSLSRLLAVIQVALNAVLLPSMAGQGPKVARVVHDRCFWAVLLAVSAAGAFCWSAGGWLLHLLYGDAFVAARPIFSVLVLEVAVGCLAGVTGQLYVALGRPGYHSIVQAASFAVLVLSVAVLLPLFGPVGVATALALSAATRLLLLLSGMPRVLGVARPSPSSILPDLARLSLLVRGR